MTRTVAHMKALKRAERMPLPQYLALWAWTVLMAAVQVVLLILVAPLLLCLLAFLWIVALHAKLRHKHDYHT